MKKTKLCAFVLCVVLILLLLPATMGAEEAVTDVSTVAELKAALEKNAGAHIRLTNDITFTTTNATNIDYGICLGEGHYTIDLNDHKIEYNNKSPNGDPNGAPLATNYARGLTINGPGDIVGGSYAIEQCNQFGTLIVNGGTLKGVINSGIRMTGGIAYINGGTVTGNFYGVFHEDGIVVLNGGSVKSVVHRTMGHTPQKYGVIKDGVFTGNAILEDIVLTVDDLTVSIGSSMKVIRGGGLIVTDSFVNNGEFTYQSGLKSIGGEAQISKDFQVSIAQDITFSSLKIQEYGRLLIENGATVTVSDAFATEQGCSIMAENGVLRLLGSIDHLGNSSGVPELAALEGDDNSGELRPEQHDFVVETEAAERLRTMGLFQGVGVNSDGSTNFDLTRAPTRTEALVMLIRLLGKEDEALSGSWEHPFIDVPAWADKYVAYAYAKDLTKGSSATEFGTGMATVQMYLTFVLRALGYSDVGGADFTWDAPEHLARNAGILPQLVRHDNFLRADMVLISEAALSARLKGSIDTLIDKLMADGVVVQIP